MIHLGFLLIITYLSIMLAIVYIKKDMSIGNFAWGGGVMLIAAYTFLANSAFLPRQILTTTLILIWGSRLATYVYLRYKKGADPRYIEWENSWIEKIHQISILGKIISQTIPNQILRLAISAGWIFGVNGFMMSIMALPILAINLSTIPGLNEVDILGLVFWIIGFICESIADFQLGTFMHNPANKGTILQTGLWKYSRHPNYFGEIMMWWGIFLIALAVPSGIYTIITPLTITITLRFITGVPWVEKVFDNNPAYQEYKKRTNTLIPWPALRSKAQ